MLIFLAILKNIICYKHIRYNLMWVGHQTLSIKSNGFVKTKIYDKRADFDFDIVNFPFLDGDVPRSTVYDVYL